MVTENDTILVGYSLPAERISEGNHSNKKQTNKQKQVEISLENSLSGQNYFSHTDKAFNLVYFARLT